jgi:gliding motility-associated-like protein
LFTHGQNKIGVTITNPSDIHLCTTSDFITIEVRNTSATGVASIETKVELPSGIEYVANSISSSNVTEKTITNLSKPVFNIPNLGITQAATFKIKVNTKCDLSTFLNNGGLPIAKTTTLYFGGSVVKNSSAFNIKQPSLQIQSITNQLKAAVIGETFTRKITVKNNGSGRLNGFQLIREYYGGHQLLGVNGGTITYGTNKTISTLDSNDFKTIGNSDIFLDFGESFVFTDSVRVRGCTNLNSRYTINWGCGGNICVSRKSAANTTITSKSAQLVYTPTSGTTACLSDQFDHNQEVLITNNGNDTAWDVDFHVFQNAGNGYYAYAISQLLTDSFTYQTSANNSPNSIAPYQTTATNKAGLFSCLGSNPKGEAYFKLPKIAPNSWIRIKWKTRSCCPTVCNANRTIYNQRWRFETTFKNQCGDVINSGEKLGSYGSYQSVTISKFTPTDISDGQTKQWEYSFSNGYLFSPSTKSKLQIELTLPSSLSHSLSTADLKFINHSGASWTPNKFTQNGNKVTAYFYGAPAIALSRSELLINLEASCNSSSSNSDKTYSMSVSFNPDTTCSSSCNIPIYCDTDAIRVHCSTGCNNGISFTGFEAKRISFGQPDNNNDGLPDATGSLDYTRVKSHRVMYGDTIQTTFKTKVNNAGSLTNWEHGKAISSLNYGRYLSVVSAQLYVYRSNNLVVTCPNVQYTSTAAGNSKTFEFNYGISSLLSSGCGIYFGYKYNSQDSLVLEVKYVVDKNIGNQNINLRIDNRVYVSTIANPANYQKYSCDSFSETMSLIGYYFTNYGRNNLQLEGCNNINTSQNFYLSIGKCCSNYAGGNIFPYEYRKWAKLKEIILIKEPGFDILGASLRQYRTKGTGATATQYISSISPYYTSNTEYKYMVDSLYEDAGGILKISDDGFTGTFTVSQKPNCKAIDGISQVKYGFVYEKVGSWPSGLDTVFSTATSDFIQYNKPDINVTVTNNYVYPEKDTALWEARITNTNTSSDASNVWLGAYNKPNAKIVAIQDKATGTYLTKSNDIFLLGDLNAQSFKDIIIYANYVSCSKDSISLYSSSDCQGYPDSIASSTCSKIATKLFYEPINSRLEARIIGTIDDIDLCDEQEIIVQIRNTGLPNVYGSFLDIILRPGMTIHDSAWLFVDGRSDSIHISDLTNVGPNTYRWTFADHDTTFKNSGIKGVKNNGGDFMNLKLKLSTDCNFTSGSGFLLKPGGFLKCGKAVNAPFTVGDAINIKGVVKPYFSAIAFYIDPLDVCNFNDSSFAKFINLGPDTTRTSDQFYLTLPLGLLVDTNFIDNQRNSPVDKPILTVINGENRYAWKLPAGIVPGDSSVFKIKTHIDNSQLNCGLKQMYAQAVVSQPALCVASNTYCDINVATSSLQTTDSVIKGVYDLTFENAISLPNGNNEDITLKYTVGNSGSNKALGDLLFCDIYYDINKNGIIEPSDSLLYRDSILSAIVNNGSITREINFSTLSAFTCDLILHISEKNCVCDFTSLAIPTIQVLNAGKDTLICHGDKINIGSEGNPQNQYSWNNSNLLLKDDTSTTILTGQNNSTIAKQIEMVLTTTKSSCSSTDTVLISHHPGMVMSLQDSVQICFGDKTIIGETVSGGTSIVKQFSWSPGDSLERTNRIKTFAYPSSNTTYTIVVTDGTGCQITDSTHITVNPRPIAKITSTDSCANTLFRFINNTDYLGTPPDSTHWNFNDLGESTTNNPLLVIDSSRILPLQLYASNQFGCWDTTTRYLEVFPIPISNFKYTPNCERLTTQLITNSVIDYGGITHNWTIEGNTFDSDTVDYQLPLKDSLTLTLLAISDKGCKDQISAKVIIYDKPEISLTTTNACLLDSIAFTPTILSGTRDAITNYEWGLGDGTTKNDSSFNFSYSDTGTFSILLEVTNANGCKDTAEYVSTIHPLPKSGFTQQDICLGDSSKLVDTSSISTGFITTILWNQGTGYTAGDDTLQITPTSIGQKTIYQKVISNFGCIDSSESEYQVYYKEESMFLQINFCENETITFSQNPNEKDSVAQTKWILLGDTFILESFDYNFPRNGVFSLHQQTTTNRGCTSEAEHLILILDAPFALISSDLPCLDNQTDFGSADGYLRYNWNLEDGTANTNQSFSHSFNSIGTYTIDLEVENSNGCIDSRTDSITITNIVTPNFEIADICEGDGQWVVNSTSGHSTPITTAIFSMGNGDEINELDSFEHTYYDDKTYTVDLKVTTLPGCDYTISKPVTVHPLPIAGFRLFPETPDIFTPAIEGLNQSVNGDSIVYFFSDGEKSISKDFEHKFLDSGRHEIKQWVSSRFGCLDSTTKEIYISFAYNLYIPNAFTPTADGLNDGFKPVGLGMKNYEMSIYNRWGEKVFESTEGQSEWDGKDALPGYYLYQIRAYDFRNNVHSYKGAVYLIR